VALLYILKYITGGEYMGIMSDSELLEALSNVKLPEVTTAPTGVSEAEHDYMTALCKSLKQKPPQELKTAMFQLNAVKLGMAYEPPTLIDLAKEVYTTVSKSKHTSVDPLDSETPGVIVQVVANHTGHCWQPGEVLITTGKPSADTYQAMDSAGVKQWMSQHCCTPIGFVQVTSETKLMEALKAYKKGNTTVVPSSLLPHTNPKTQKAKGLLVLSKLYFPSLVRPGIPMLINKKTAGSFDISQCSSPNLIARPCPIKPRHGFVESRKVKTNKQLQQVVKETLAADPNGEVLVMPFLDCKYSSIVTDTSVTMGPGNDGATSAKGSHTIQCTSDIRNWIKQKYPKFAVVRDGEKVLVDTLKYLGFNDKTQPFLEVVGNYGVQLRTGPTVDTSLSKWIPYTIDEITCVYEVDHSVDFLAYEKELDKLKEMYNRSVVVYVKDGGMASHYAVQAVTRNIAVVTSPEKKPSVGGYYYNKIVTNKALHTRKELREGIAAGIEYGCKVTGNNEGNELEWATAVIQGMATAHLTPITMKLVTAAAILLCKAGTAACLGEHRHFWWKGCAISGYNSIGPVSSSFRRATGGKPTTGKFGRDHIYDAVFTLDWSKIETWEKAITMLTLAKADFLIPHWGGSFGGKPWADCTDAAIESLLATLYLVYRKPGLGTIGADVEERVVLDYYKNKVVAACNKLITVCHNGGRCLTKMVSTEHFDAISMGLAGVYIATNTHTWEILNHDNGKHSEEQPEAVSQ
jgi:hypothetical protein